MQKIKIRYKESLTKIERVMFLLRLALYLLISSERLEKFFKTFLYNKKFFFIFGIFVENKTSQVITQ